MNTSSASSELKTTVLPMMCATGYASDFHPTALVQPVASENYLSSSMISSLTMHHGVLVIPAQAGIYAGVLDSRLRGNDDP
ncbi:MAG: hypothetical protein ACK526_24015 [Planctomyces sp.]|jgi:hypothetical protein